MGLFAEWRPHYAAHGIATFPVRDKRPAVKGYLKIGDQVSEQLALKFANDNTFGFACRRSKITVLDVDAPDERLLADALDQHGPTPLIIRSGSGNFQAWYRHNGEGRRIRPDPGKPIDILGDGFVVAPPSLGSKGQYQIILGTLADIERLPTMRLTRTAVAAPTPKLLCTESIPDKQTDTARNNALWRDCMKAARGCAGITDLMEKAVSYNETAFYEPLPAEEVLKIVASAWSYEVHGKNWFGHGARVVFDAAEVDDLASKEPRAFALLSILRRHHWGRDFALSMALAEKLEWAPNTLRTARDVLVREQRIECLHPGGRGPNDPPIYRFP
jgi:hypothetical protein